MLDDRLLAVVASHQGDRGVPPVSSPSPCLQNQRTTGLSLMNWGLSQGWRR